MVTTFKRNFPKRFVPYWNRTVVSKNIVAEKLGEDKSTMNKENREKLTKKKKSHEDFDVELEKRLSPNEKPSKINVPLSEDEDVQDIKRELEMDDID